LPALHGMSEEWHRLRCHFFASLPKGKVPSSKGKTDIACRQ
jgi:hypothetical protein